VGFPDGNRNQQTIGSTESEIFLELPDHNDSERVLAYWHLKLLENVTFVSSKNYCEAYRRGHHSSKATLN